MTRTMTDSALQQPIKVVWLALLVLLAIAMFAGFTALGIWQVQRLYWKLDLIERVEQRVNALPVDAPTPSEWATVNRQKSEYRRVLVTGHFDHSKETLVRASTELGRGFWVMTPLRTTAGFWVMVNRGFVPTAESAQASQAVSAQIQQVSGLLRLSEPGGSLLQRNNAVEGRWYSRDVQAIASEVNLSGTSDVSGAALIAPYFIDADAQTSRSSWPREGLTVIQFNNHHVIYAITWFVLAAMLACATVYLLRSELKLRAAMAAVKPEFSRA